MKTTGTSKRLYWLFLSMLLTVLSAAPFFASTAKVTVIRPSKGKFEFIYTDSTYSNNSTIVSWGVKDKDFELNTSSKDAKIKVIATDIATPTTGYGWRFRKGSETLKVEGAGNFEYTIPQGDTSTYVLEAVTAEVTVKAPKKGSVTFLDKTHALTFTLNAGDSDKAYNVATNSAVELALTADGVSAGGDCYQWTWTANGAPDPDSPKKGGECKIELSKFDKTKLAISVEDTHKPQLVAQVDATCTATGTAAYYKCDVCGKMYSDSAGTKEITAPEVIPVIAHTLTTVAQVDATCEKAGTKAYYKCSVCSKMFSDSAGTKEITKPEEIPALGHDWDAGVVTTKATTSQTGVRTYTCKRDKTHTKTETIPKLETPETEAPKSEKAISADEVQMAADAITPQNPGKTETVEETLSKGSLAWKKDLPGATFSLLQAKAVAKISGVKLTWKKVSGAKKYIVYGKPYGKKFKLEKLYEGTARKYTHKELKNKKYQKYIVLAVKGTKTLAISKAIFVAPKGTYRGNVSKVSVTPKKLTLLNGKKKTLKASYTKSGTLKTYRKICFESGNVKVATVTTKGKVKITGKKGDSTWIYAYAQNGVFAKIKVTVK